MQAWIEASTKGGVLLFTASEIESATVAMGVNPAAAGLLGGMGGGIVQAYATMGKQIRSERTQRTHVIAQVSVHV